MPGFPKHLEEILEAPREGRNIEFKAGMSWKSKNNAEKGELAKDMSALGNSGGGWLIFGFDDDTLTVDGNIPKDHGFEVTKIGDFLATRFKPQIELEVFHGQWDNQLVVAVNVLPFRHEPHICQRELNSVLRKAALYIRTARATSEEITDPYDMRDLVSRAVAMRMSESQVTAESVSHEELARERLQAARVKFEDWVGGL